MNAETFLVIGNTEGRINLGCINHLQTILTMGLKSQVNFLQLSYYLSFHQRNSTSDVKKLKKAPFVMIFLKMVQKTKMAQIAPSSTNSTISYDF